MAKDLRTFIADCQRELPGEVIHITKEVNPANYDVTAIIKHLGAQKKFPIIIFDNPLNLNGKVGPIKLTMNCEISQGRPRSLWACRAMRPGRRWRTNALRWKSIACRRRSSARKTRRSRKTPWSVKESISTRFRSCAITKWTAVRTSFCRPSPKIEKAGSTICSYHRMEVKSKNTTALYASPRHLWKIFKD